MQSLQPLENEYKLYWNNRIDRFPYMYPTYSELINHSIDTSNTEWIILINDRCHPTIQEVKKMISLLENGFSCVLLYSVGFMGFSKELIRTIGWWDQRFIQGWEDRDWVWRIK
jgi:GT2 family glycosyltransferase